MIVDLTETATSNNLHVEHIREIEKVPSKLRKNGFTYSQICRGGRSFVYEQHVIPKITYYEGVKLRIRPECEIFGKSYPARERFPGNEDFGICVESVRYGIG